MKLAEKANVIDLKGAYLTDNDLNEASARILDNYGVPTKMYLPIGAASKFSEQFYPDQRALMNVQAGNVVAGTNVTQFNSVGGTIDLSPNVFMRQGLEKLAPNQAAYGNAPTPPTIAAALDATITDGAHEEGTVKYAVVAMNSQGRAVPVESAAIAVTAADVAKGVKLTITNSAIQINAPDYFIIYRTENNGADYYEIGKVGATSRDKSAATVFVDKNEVIPNTASAIVGDFREEALTFRQLAPLFKLDYALTGPIKRFGIFLYGMPILYTPKRFIVIKNIKVK